MQTQKDLIVRQKDLRAKQETPHHHGEYFVNSIRVGVPTNQVDASKTKKHSKQSPQPKPIGSEVYRPPIGGLDQPRSAKLSPGLVLMCV